MCIIHWGCKQVPLAKLLCGKNFISWKKIITDLANHWSLCYQIYFGRNSEAHLAALFLQCLNVSHNIQCSRGPCFVVRLLEHAARKLHPQIRDEFSSVLYVKVVRLMFETNHAFFIIVLGYRFIGSGIFRLPPYLPCLLLLIDLSSSIIMDGPSWAVIGSLLLLLNCFPILWTWTMSEHPASHC